MRKRLVIAAVCILALPLLYSASQSDKATNPSSYATVALAGHTTAGNWCDCGTPGCICDPGELAVGRSSRSVPDRSTQDTPRELGSKALLAFAVLLLMLRYKA